MKVVHESEIRKLKAVIEELKKSQSGGSTRKNWQVKIPHFYFSLVFINIKLKAICFYSKPILNIIFSCYSFGQTISFNFFLDALLKGNKDFQMVGSAESDLCVKTV